MILGWVRCRDLLLKDGEDILGGIARLKARKEARSFLVLHL